MAVPVRLKRVTMLAMRVKFSGRFIGLIIVIRYRRIAIKLNNL